MIVTTNGSERMRIDSSGNVGIGVVPSNRLDIEANNGRARLLGSTGYILLDVQNTGGSFTFGKEGSAGGQLVTGAAAYDSVIASQGAEPIHLATNAAIRATIAANGNVGIGTTALGMPLSVRGVSDANDNFLRLDNNKYSSANTSGETGILFGWLNHAAASIKASKETANRTGLIFSTEVGFNVPVEAMRITSSGNVGVTEGAKVYFGGFTDPSSHYIKYNSGNNGLELNSYGSTIFTNTLSGTERMRIDSSGRVGIATTSLEGNVGLTVDGTGGSLDGTSATTKNKASFRASSIGPNGLGTGTSIFMGVEDSNSTWIQAQHISDNGEKTLKLNPAGGNVKIPKGKLVDENSTPYQFAHLQNWGGSSYLTHKVGYIGTTGDPTAAYVLLCPAYDSTLKYKDFCYGSVFRQRGNPSAGHVSGQAIIQVASAYNSNIAGGVRLGTGSMEEFRLCTYNGVRYISLVLGWSSATDLSVDLWYTNASYPPILVDDGAVSNVSTLNSLISAAP